MTFNNTGSGASSGTAFNGSAAQTISYNTIGAPSTTGTNASGTWGISISGNSATSTVANGLTGTPSISIENLAGSGTVTLAGIEPSTASCLQISTTGVVTATGSACATNISYTGSSGYQKLPGGLVLSWVTGTQISSSSTQEQIVFPYTAYQNVYLVQTGTIESSYDDTEMPVFVVISNTNTYAMVAMQRTADHGYVPATPTIFVIGD
ncbi:Uncharacterised protein [uncultured archaeon]|nr:Uncharacterised protein [uncultured archaeon]